MTRTEALKIAKPIPFETEMVRAILGGTKTVTRRLINPQPESKNDFIYCHECGEWFISPDDDKEQEIKIESSYRVGDILYVQETWGFDKNNWLYKADFSDTDLKKLKNIMHWLSPIRMPKEAARIFLRVTDVRVERLQDIDGYGILAEGVDNGRSNPTMGERWENMQRMTYSDLWDSTIKKADIDKYGWKANPYVWIIEFRRLEVE